MIPHTCITALITVATGGRLEDNLHLLTPMLPPQPNSKTHVQSEDIVLTEQEMLAVRLRG